ncbi:hypothetical protein [Janthinobacterium lividum]|uniref:hypothetical protein n=1 Tax=Janthinobacterium lividum TaxID=29581 RepID=UPI0014096B3C|nr:hypothetical protein [Janthinobacterium lividum]NHQ91348.1 hypothetical protein [Janthinobacterium lividum]
MRPWLRRCLLTVSVFALCWTGAIAYWRDSTRMPAPGELAGAMLVLPLALLLMLWLGKKLLAKLLAGPALAAAPGLAAPLQAEAAAPPATPAPLHIVAATVRMPGGATPAQLLAAMRSRQARPALDGQLLDEDGYPLLCGRVDGIDEEAQQPLLTAWLREHPQAGLASEPFPFNPEDLRALALGAQVLAELLDEALQHALSAGAPASLAGALPMLRLHLLMPASWSAAQRQAGDAWLRHLAREQGWPVQKLLPAAEPATGQPAPFALLNALAGDAPPQPPCLSIVLACDSWIGELRVHALASQGQLFSAAQANGQIPGEGAAGLLLAAPGATAPQDEPAPVLLHRAATGELPQGASQRGETDKSLLADLGRQALAAAGDDAAAGIALVSADTDQRAPRMLELMQCAGALVPQLDLAEQVLGVGAACGQCGAVTTLAALAMARQAAADDVAQVLCLSNLDPLQRGALVIGPPAESSHSST